MHVNLVVLIGIIFVVCSERFKETVLQERKKSAVELLDFISRYPHLSQSSHFHLFIAVSLMTITV